MDQEQRIIFESNVPATMRDGTVLRADVYRPNTNDKYPTLLIRMPYNKSLPRYHIFFDPLRVAKNGYAVVWQDCRGTMASDGEFDPFLMDGSDGYDTVEWIATQPWSSGKVGMYGLSYHGFVQLAAATEQPPHLTAIVPGMVGIGPKIKSLFYVGGAIELHLALLWSFHMSLLKLVKNPPSPQEMIEQMGKIMKAADNLEEQAKFLPLKELPSLQETGLADFYFDWLSHPDDDEYWKKYECVSFEKIHIPTFFFTGWFDICQRCTLASYKIMNELGVSGQNNKKLKLIIGPWIHSVDLSQQVGEIDFGLGSAGSTIDILGMHLRWFDYWLKNLDSGIMAEPPVRIFVMGDNVWRDENEWPLARTEYMKYYFHSDGRANSLNGDGHLSLSPPRNEDYDTYLYDPRNPVPTKGGNLLTLTGVAGSFDQHEIEERSDVLIYSTPELERDIEVTGPIKVKLFAASSATDTDFVAKLVDVWPNGKTYNIASGIIRARYRDSLLSHTLIEPEKVYEYTIDLWATSNVFKAGHQIRVEVTSSNFPRYDRNPNTGQLFGEDAELKSATQKIFHDRERPSHIVLPVIPR